MIKNTLRSLDIDLHVGSAMLLRAWTILAGGTLIVLIPMTLTKIEQGFYFTFSSLLATQVFFELGLNTVITQIAGHEMAHLTFDSSSEPQGSPYYLSRLHSLFSLSKNIYLAASLLFFSFSFLGGLFFFRSSPSANLVSWKIAWLLLTLLAGINLYLSPFLAGLEGIGMVAQVAKLRLKQSFLGYVILWVLLIFHQGLLSVVAVPLCSVVLSLIWLRKKNQWLFKKRLPLAPDNQISWKKEIFPFQWKIAASWVSGYFISQLFNPVVFKHFGAEEAGRIGLSLAIFTSISLFSFSWVSAKIPVFTQLIALKKRRDLNKVFIQVLARSSILNIICSLCFLILIRGLTFLGFKTEDRLSNFSILICLAMVAFANHIIFSCASFMRAHKEEPMVTNSLVTGALITGAVYAGSFYSPLAMMILYLFTVMLIALPWTLILLKKYYYRKE